MNDFQRQWAAIGAEALAVVGRVGASGQYGNGVARVGAGGGIVAESDPESEWIEANHKARALTRARR